MRIITDDTVEVHFGLRTHTTGPQITFTVKIIPGTAAPVVLVM